MTTLTTMTTMLMSSLTPGSALWSRWRQARQTVVEPPSPQRRAAEEAAELRALADTYRRSDPGFASDLFAAADRHERDAAAR
jgi:hypothetical protein